MMHQLSEASNGKNRADGARLIHSLYHTYTAMLQPHLNLKSFRNLYARLLHHLPHTADVLPPSSPLTCKCHCTSNQMMQRKDSLLEPSTRSLLENSIAISKRIFSSTINVQGFCVICHRVLEKWPNF